MGGFGALLAKRVSAGEQDIQYYMCPHTLALYWIYSVSLVVIERAALPSTTGSLGGMLARQSAPPGDSLREVGGTMGTHSGLRKSRGCRRHAATTTLPAREI